MDLSSYKKVLASFCRYYIQLMKLCNMAMDGEVIEEDTISKTLGLVGEYKDKLLVTKEALGFKDGLTFSESANFEGFCIENGMIIGDGIKTLTVANDWTKKFENDELPNVFFEVANLIYFILNPLDIKESLEQQYKQMAA